MGTGFVSEKHPEELFDACIEEACKRYGMGVCSGASSSFGTNRRRPGPYCPAILFLLRGNRFVPIIFYLYAADGAGRRPGPREPFPEMTVDDIALTMHPEIGSRTAIHLVECFGSAERLFAATQQEIVLRSGLKPELARSISRREYHGAAERELAFVERHRIRAIDACSAEYPRRLKECPDYPHVIYVSGGTDLNSSRWLSVVGTRRMTPYGAMLCERLIGELAALVPDAVIVSGLAYGVDIEAHRAAMNAGLRTVGVVAHPLTRIYPSRHTESARRMVQQGGAIVSEFHSGCRCDRSSFVQRNRIIAGLSEGTLVIESAAKGGSLITAEMADGYERTVMAVPGRIDDDRSQGTNRLIRSLKAQMVCSGRDIADCLGWEPVPEARPAEGDLFGGSERALPAGQADLLTWIDGVTPRSVEELELLSGLEPGRLSELVMELELAGIVRAVAGDSYIKISKSC